MGTPSGAGCQSRTTATKRREKTLRDAAFQTLRSIWPSRALTRTTLSISTAGVVMQLTRRPWLVAFNTSLQTKASLSPTSLTWAGGRGRGELPCTPRSCEDQPQKGIRRAAHPHRVQGLLRWGEAHHQDEGGDGDVRAADQGRIVRGSERYSG